MTPPIGSKEARKKILPSCVYGRHPHLFGHILRPSKSEGLLDIVEISTINGRKKQ
jgi:hypothetical protein